MINPSIKWATPPSNQFINIENFFKISITKIHIQFIEPYMLIFFLLSTSALNVSHDINLMKKFCQFLSSFCITYTHMKYMWRINRTEQFMIKIEHNLIYASFMTTKRQQQQHNKNYLKCAERRIIYLFFKKIKQKFVNIFIVYLYKYEHYIIFYFIFHKKIYWMDFIYIFFALYVCSFQAITKYFWRSKFMF